MKITKEHTMVIDILLNILIKLAVAASSICAFWFILFRVLDPKLPQLQTVALTVVDSILGGTMFVMISHYFPAFKAAFQHKNSEIENE